jgi:peptide/nickel transport system substrate-binding protein
MEVPMVRFLLVLTVLFVVLCSSALAAAGSQSPGSVIPVSEFASATGDFVVALDRDVAGLDAAVVEDTASLLVAAQIYDTLVVYRPSDSFPMPGLAQSWSESADGLTWTFNLHPGVRFQDGTVLDADAVVFNIRRWWDAANPYHNGNFVYFESLFGGFRGDPGCLITDVRAVGSTQVQLVLRLRAGVLPSLLAWGAFGIASPTAIQAGTLGVHPVGSGPFSFVERVPADRIRLAANAAYWGGAPHLAGLVFQVISDSTARFAALKSGTVHSAEGYAPGAATDPDLHPMSRPSLNIGYLGINQGHTPLNSPLVRQAIAHAINRPALVASHYGSDAQVAQQFLPSGVWGYDPSLPDYSYDPVLAKSLLSQAGYASGFATTLIYRNVVRGYLPNPPATAAAIHADLAAVGIDAAVIEMESSAFLNKVYAGDADLFLLGWFADYPHPANFLTYHFCGGNLSLGPYDDDLCAALAAAEIDPDLYSQLPRYRWAAGRAHSTVPALPLVHTSTSLTVRWDVMGLLPSSEALESYHDVYFGGAEAPIAPATGGTLVYTDPAGSPTTVAVPSAAVAEPVTLRLTTAENAQVPPDLGASGHAFDLTALQEGVPLEHLVFAQPVALTVSYSDADVARLKEKTLVLYTWDGTAWVDAATTCSPALPYVVDEPANQITVQICHLSHYALFGEKLPTLYLPLIVRAGL